MGKSSGTRPATRLGMTDLERRWLLGLMPPEAGEPELTTVAIDPEEAVPVAPEPEAAPIAIEPDRPASAAPARPTIPEIYRVVVACCSSPSSFPIDQPDKKGRPGI